MVYSHSQSDYCPKELRHRLISAVDLVVVLRLRLHGAVLGGGARGRVCAVVDEAGPSGFRRY